MRKYSLIDDGQGNYRYGNVYELFQEEERVSEPDQKSTLRALLRDADEVIKQMTLDELKAKITAILPGATFEVNELGQIVIRSSVRMHTDPKTWAEPLREKARDFVPPKKGLFGKRK